MNEERINRPGENIYQDVPLHKEGETGSIGGLWPPKLSTHRRIKAIFDSTISDGRTFFNFYNEFSRRNNPDGFGVGDEIKAYPTRIQFRAILEAALFRNPTISSAIADNLEAFIPLETSIFGREPVLIYLSANSKSRESNDEDLETIRSNIETASHTERRSVDAIFSRPLVNGYTIEILQDRGAGVTEQIANLYERFGWNIKEVEGMLSEHNNIFSVARIGRNIVSAGIAEVAQVPINGKSFRMAEITEAATLGGHDSQGLYTAVSARLLTELASMSKNNELGGNIDLVFGECNGLSLGVLKVAKTQGRTFSTDVGKRFGFPDSGILHQQVPINGAERHTEYNDLIPAFLTTGKLHKYYG